MCAFCCCGFAGATSGAHEEKCRQLIFRAQRAVILLEQLSGPHVSTSVVARAWLWDRHTPSGARPANTAASISVDQPRAWVVFPRGPLHVALTALDGAFQTARLPCTSTGARSQSHVRRKPPAISSSGRALPYRARKGVDEKWPIVKQILGCVICHGPATVTVAERRRRTYTADTLKTFRDTLHVDPESKNILIARLPVGSKTKYR